jgi:tetratricopeptide (TPR) repeat protein
MRRTVTVWLVRGAALALAVVALDRLVYQPWRAQEILLAVGERSKVAVNANRETAAILARGNIERLRSVAPATRTDANYYMLFAANARMLGEDNVAVQQYTAALTYADHRPEIFLQRGLTLLDLGRVDAAAADLTHAARFNPMVLEQIDGELRERVRRDAGIP